MDDLPQGWLLKPLGEIADVVGGKRLPEGEQLVRENTGYIYFRVSDMRENGVILDDLHYLPPHVAPRLNRYRVKEGDLYIVVVGNTIGKSGIVPSSLDGAYLTENANRITNIQINPIFLLSVIQSSIVQKVIDKLRTDNAQPKLALTRLRDFLIPIPPYEEQRKIAAILGTWDKAIGLVEQLIEALQARKKGLMQKLLTGEVRFKEFEGEEWKDVLLGDVGDVITGSTPSTTVAEYYDDEYLFVSPADLGNRKYINSSEKKLSAKGLSQSRPIREGGILFTCIGSTIGKTGIAGQLLATNQQINSVICFPEFDNEFVYYALNYIAPHIKKLAGTQAVPIVNKTIFSQQMVFTPEDKTEQERIAKVLSKNDSGIESLVKYRDLLQEQKRGLMQALLTGQVRI